MYKLLGVVLLTLIFSLPASAASAPPHGESDKAEASTTDGLNKNLALVGGGLLGIILVSGAASLISVGSMMFEGAGFTEAMESGLGLSLPITVLSAILGAVFAQDFVLRNLNSLNLSEYFESPKPAH
jgi:hypothetical protein